MKSLLLLALGLARTVVLGARIEAERIVVSVRPYKREQRRCPVCGRACGFYDMASRGAPRLWRAMDLARSACYLEYAPCRVRCPEHGVRTEAVPWARHGARFTRDFEDWVAWLAVRCTASAVSELARVEWHGVGGVCPFALNEGVDVFLDESLRRFDTVYPAAGNAASAVRLTPDELERCAAPCTWVDVCKVV